MALRIKDWSLHFENNRTRELKELRFVILPNKQDGDGYTELLDHPNGAAHFGAWCSIVEVASKCQPRGTLLRDSDRPHDSISLARQTRIPIAVFDEVLPRLIKIGWIEVSDQQTLLFQPDIEPPQEGGTIPHPPAENRPRREENRTEENGIEEKGIQKRAHAAKPRSPSASTNCDEDFLIELQSDEAYQRLNVKQVYAKMVRWCRENGKVATRRRLINWLNREDQPLIGNRTEVSTAPARTPTIREKMGIQQ